MLLICYSIIFTNSKLHVNTSLIFYFPSVLYTAGILYRCHMRYIASLSTGFLGCKSQYCPQLFWFGCDCNTSETQHPEQPVRTIKDLLDYGRLRLSLPNINYLLNTNTYYHVNQSLASTIFNSLNILSVSQTK